MLACVALAGCASLSADGGRSQVQQLVQQRGGPAAPPVAPAMRAAHIAALLQRPLGADDAVAIALLNNPGLQAGYAELGIAEADLVQAGRVANPVFSFSRLKGHDGVEIERKLMLPVIGLLLMPITRPLEQRRYELAQLRTAAGVLRVADDTRRAWYAAVAAQQSALYMEQVKDAAEASAELARRMNQAGNWSKLQQAREQAFHADAVAQLARARQASVAGREQLTRLMGLADGAFQLPERLPELPAAPRALGAAESQALANRLDVLMAQKELAGLSASLGLSRSTRFINLLDLGYLRDKGADGARATGYEIELQIPLFDWGSARVARAEASYMQAAQRAAGTAVDARSQVRESYAAYRSAYDIARHYRDEIVPLKKRISDEQLLRYNGMLISVFELLADARDQVTSVNGAIEAQRDFWMADAALQAALTGSGAGSVPAARASAASSAGGAPQH
jgi:outer membrane protein TolC